MPLPNRSIPWPPRSVSRTYALVAEWAAWWTGDPNELSNFYASNPRTSQDGTQTRRPWMFWTRKGTKADSGTITKLHVPVAGDVATFSADLLFSDEPEFRVPAESDSEQTPTLDRISDMSAESGLVNTLLEAAEAAAALGGVYLRPAWDASLIDVPFLTAIDPDNAVPVFSWGRLRSVTFWETLEPVDPKKDDVYRHLELHEVIGEDAVITHGLYRGKEGTLGTLIPLNVHPTTEGLASLVDQGQESDLELRIVLAGLGRLDVEYVPNMKPNRRNRGSAEGRSDLEGLEGLLDALDEVYTSWMRDIRLGQSRIIVPAEFLEKGGRGSGASFDVDSDVFTPLEIDPNIQEKAGITIVQFTLRTAEHLETALSLLERIVDSAGYSPMSFGLNMSSGAPESGTARKIRERKSFTTQAKKRRYWAPPVERSVETLLYLGREVFGWDGLVHERPSIVWPDTTTPGLAEMATTLDSLKRAVSVSVETRVRMLHPDWSPEDVDAEVVRIIDEEGLTVEPPEMVGGIDVPPPGVLSDVGSTVDEDPEQMEGS